MSGTLPSKKNSNKGLAQNRALILMKNNQFSCRSEACEASKDAALNPSSEPTLGDIINARFTPDDKTLVVAVQRRATDGTKDHPGLERSSTFEDPATRWPDFDPKLPPRAAVVFTTKNHNGVIAS